MGAYSEGKEIGKDIGEKLGVNEKIGEHIDKHFEKSDQEKMDAAEKVQAQKTRDYLDSQKK